MSFILDALRKAESERNRGIAPVLMDARLAQARRPLPGWAWMLGVVLLANLALLAWMLLRPAPTVIVADGAPPVLAASASAPATAPAAAFPPVLAPPPSDADDAGDLLPVDPGNPGEIVISPDDIVITPPSRAPLADASSTSAPATASPGASEAIDLAGLPSAAQLRAQGVTIPELELNLHIYDPLPAHRWVLLNGQRYVEGEFLPSGIKVERIAPEGLVLVAGGRRFRVGAGG